MNGTSQPQNSTAPLISVVICTRNRADLLSCALTSVVEQVFPAADYEVLVVDNDSNDFTSDVVHQFQNRARVRYLKETRIGLCIARNTGWRSAAGKYIAFFDDDAIASPGWLAAVREGFANSSQAVGVIGGPVRPIWEKPRPEWLPDEIVCSLTVIDWGSSEKFIEDISREWLVGANMAVPKALLTEVGGFHPWLDRVGNNLLSSGDVFLQKEIARRGYSCLYKPSMVIGHVIPASRLKREWFIRRYYWQGVSDAVMHLIETNPSYLGRVRLAVTRAIRLLRSALGRSHLISRATSPEHFAQKCYEIADLGFAAGMLGAARR